MLPPIQRGPAVWVGSEMGQGWLLELSPAEIDELEAAGARHARGALGPIEASDFPLPSLAPKLASLRAELLEGRGFFVLRGLPVARYTRIEQAAIFLGIGAHLGRARSQNAKGHLLGHVYDLGLSGDDPNVRIYQTHQRQTFHTDSCDVVGLLCLREAPRGGDSLLVSALTIFNEMRRDYPDLLARLLEPMPHDRRGEVPAGMKPFFEIPVFSWFQGLLTVFYQRQYFDSAQRFASQGARRLTDDDVAALDRFDALANDARLQLSMRLAPGDMQFVHNHVLLHDRTAFEDDPRDKRHLLRLWLACPGARPLPEAFAARYGSLEVGDRGGIVVPGTRLCVPLEPE